jgi:hypothetical protein
MFRLPFEWQKVSNIGPALAFRCGFCGRDVASGVGFYTSATNVFVAICPMCNQPSYFDLHEDRKIQIPGHQPGGSVEHLPPPVESLYAEARAAMAANAPTVAVLGFRKLLMHIAVEKGAAAGDTFQNYVNYLEQHITCQLARKIGSTTFVSGAMKPITKSR